MSRCLKFPIEDISLTNLFARNLLQWELRLFDQIGDIFGQVYDKVSDYMVVRTTVKNNPLPSVIKENYRSLEPVNRRAQAL